MSAGRHGATKCRTMRKAIGTEGQRKDAVEGGGDSAAGEAVPGMRWPA